MAKANDWLTKEALAKVEGWARDGLFDEQIAEQMGISVSTFYAWKKKYPEFSESIKKSKEVADRFVENALYENATGRAYTEEVVAMQKEVTYKDGKREREVVTPVAVPLQKFKPPETTAQIYWLNNRKPDQWKNRRDGANVGSPTTTDAEKDEKPDKLALLSNYARRRA